MAKLETENVQITLLRPSDVTLTDLYRLRHKHVDGSFALENSYALAESFLEHGQQTPIEVRVVGKGADREYRVFKGGTRTEAGLLIENGFYSPSKVNEDGTPVYYPPNPDFRLRAILRASTEISETDAILAGIADNDLRQNYGPMDYLTICESLLGKKHPGKSGKWTQADIAREVFPHWGSSAQVRVSNICKLRGLAPELRDMVADGGLSVDGAITIVENSKSDDDQREMIHRIIETSGRATASAIKAEVQRAELLRRVKSGEVEVESEIGDGDIILADTDPDNPIGMLDDHDPETTGKEVLEVTTASVEPSPRTEPPTGEESAEGEDGKEGGEAPKTPAPAKTPREKAGIPAPSPKLPDASPKTLKQVKELLTRWVADEKIGKSPWKLAFCEEMLLWLDGHTRGMVPRRFLLEIKGDPSKPAPGMTATEEQAVKAGESIDML